MVYRGHVENGVIQLEGAVILPEGAEVRVELTAEKEGFDQTAPRIEEVLRHHGGRSPGGMGPVAGGPD